MTSSPEPPPGTTGERMSASRPTGVAAIGDVLRHEGEPLSLVCSEVWGGNRAFFGPVELPGMRGVLFSQPCDGALGGDVHYLSVCGSGLILRLCLADVSGHGQSVAAISSAMHDQLRRSVNRFDERKVLRRLNLRLSRQGLEALTTAAAITYFPPTRRLSISYAGHEPASYYQAETDTWTVVAPRARTGLFDLPLAVENRARYSHRVLRVSRGDRLVVVTDGVLETPSPTGELFGRKRLSAVLRDTRRWPCADAASKIVDALHEHSGGAPLQHDDVTFLLAEFVDNLQSPALWMIIKNRLLRRGGKIPQPRGDRQMAGESVTGSAVRH